MIYQEIRNSILSRFQGQWGTRCKVDYPINKGEFSLDADDGKDYDHSEYWVRIRFVTGEATRAASGGLISIPGIITISLFIPLGDGTMKGHALAEAARRIFSGQSFEGINCKPSSFKEVSGPESSSEIDSTSHHINITTPFRMVTHN